MGIGQKLKDTLSSDHSDRKQYENTPGSFPTDNVSSGRHGDGTQYSAPTGTAVGSTGHTGVAGRTEGAAPSNYGTSGYGAAGHGTSGYDTGLGGRRVDDRNVMDPADTKHGSNVMGSTGTASNPLSSHSASDRYAEDRTTGDHSNKLHRRDDPRRYGDNTTGTGMSSGTGGLASTGMTERGHVGQENFGQGRNLTGHNSGAADHGREPAGYDRDTSGSYDSDPRTTTSNIDRSHGVYGSNTGSGGREDTGRTHHAGRYDERSTPGTAGTGSGHRDQEGQSTMQRVKETLNPRTGNEVGSNPNDRNDYNSNTSSTGIGSRNSPRDHHDSTTTGANSGAYHTGRDQTDSRSSDQYNSRNTGAASGAPALPHRPQDTSNTQREHIGPSGDSRVLDGSRGGSGLTGAGASGIAAHEAGKHHTDRYDDTSRSAYDRSGTTSGQRGYETGNTDTTGVSSSHNDNGRMAGASAQRYDQGHNQGHAGGQDGAIDNIRNKLQERGVPVGTESSHSTGHNYDQSSTGSNAPGSSHQRPGHESAKVMHTCSHCGRDDDISRYFGKEAVWRMGQ